MNLSTLDNTSFNPSGKHQYTIYAVEGNNNAIYIESDKYGDECAIKYVFDDEYEIEDTEGSFCPSDTFDNAVINLVKSTKAIEEPANMETIEIYEVLNPSFKDLTLEFQIENEICDWVVKEIKSGNEFYGRTRAEAIQNYQNYNNSH